MKVWQWVLLTIVFAGTIVASFLDPEEKTPAVFYAAFGFFGCLLLIFLAKVVGKKLLMRKENYYDAP